VLGNEDSALHRTIIDWLSTAGPVPKPVMQFDNVEAIKSVVAVGLGASIVPSLCLGAGHVTTVNTLVVPLKPRVSRAVGLVRMRGKQDTEAMKIVSTALLRLGPGRTRVFQDSSERDADGNTPFSQPAPIPRLRQRK
jgi:DNA-binding transcriptional LysR family regulator